MQMWKSNMSTSKVHACDQCRARRARCDRQLPKCSSCIERKLTCTLNREFTYATHATYQNISTFSIAKRGKPRSRAPRKPAKPNDHLLPCSEEITSPMLLATTTDINKWFVNPYSRFIINYFIKLSGIPLAVTSARDVVFLSEMLTSRLNAMSSNRKEIVHLQAGKNEHILLAQATDAYFHFFNPYHMLFTRHGYHSRPRSELLKLSVWRAGLQFLAASPERKALAEHIDTMLFELTRPSQLRIRLDVLQSYLILSLGLVDSRVLKRMAVFRDSLVSLIYALGIHVRATSLEAVLAYRLCISRDARFALTMDTTTHFATEFSRNMLYPPKTAADSCMRMLKAFDEICANPESCPVWCGKPLEPAVGPERLHAAVSSAMDTCALIANNCLYENSVIQQKANHCFTIHPTDVQRIYTTIAWADRSLFTTFCTALSKLRRMRAEIQSRMLAYTHTLAPYRAHLANFNFVLKVFDQSILFLATQYLNSRLYIVGFASHIDPKDSDNSPLRPITQKITPIATSCLNSAITLMPLLDRIGSSPFSYVKSAPLSKAYILIAQHYHAYCQHQPTPQASAALKAKFNHSLVLARRLLTSLLPCPISGFLANNSITFFDAFLAHHKIKIDNSS
ncbi:hypothetical protein DSO57_1029744 [Entomophthora muscae]|uniref:Uncharacterized protein n=1 Tax=Entomophthora muscae TaxID=34485 RepID=A0ACC2TCA7_9FUNG|nr:hypothetical protein DSO57_1029744 [Entomophthora muscae]